ncbi:MAG: protein-L-isoaspartate O-methyltransferase [Rhodocyclaceae bacterium]|nr:protein-L-isoaspartate O-methyltransferase [Rhodocyclaceae bacterium]
MDIELARYNMVEQQLRPWDITNQDVLELFRTVRREDFVPPSHRNLAFAEMELPIGHGQHMLKPIMEGKLLQAAQPQKGERVLEIGTGSGWFTALLAQRAEQVTSIECITELAQTARSNLAYAQVKNVEVVEGDAFTEALSANDPFDLIIATGSVSALPESWQALLRPGARLLAIVGQAPVQEAVLLEHTGEQITRRSLFETCIPPLKEAAAASFVF